MTHVTGKEHSNGVQAAELLAIIRGLAEELHPDQDVPAVTLDSSLERDLGLDSLSRMELLARLENIFHIRLPEQVMATAETPRDLLRHLERHEIHPTERPQQKDMPAGGKREDIQSPHSALTLTEVLEYHAASHPDRTHILLDGYGDDPVPITYDKLYRGAQRVAAGLQQANLQPAETVAIILPTGMEYFFSFFGVLLAGGIPVPLYPPVRPTQIEEHLRRHSGILRNAGTRILITMPEVKPVIRLLRMQVTTLEHVKTVPELETGEQEFTPLPLHPGDTAFLQYTSGSTGDPKGVILSHASLLANIRAMGQATRVTAADVFVSWLPLYHDMGLIGAWLGSLYYGCRLIIMPPMSFIARPERWLQAIHKHHGTMSASPNFGYELCCRRISDTDIDGLDLGSWRLAFNGAEPVTPETVTNFCRRFAACGFNKEAMAPVYGLAESSVGLAFPPLDRGPLIDRIDRDTFTRSGRAVPAADGEIPALEFVACGRPLPGHQIRIVDRADRELPEREEGILQFKGPSSTSGYFRSPDKTRALFHGEWLDSGDLAYIAGGDVYVTGRIKDVIIRGGRNVYPHEFEEAVGNISGIRKGSVAVFGSRDEVSGTERLIVLAESRKKNPEAVEQLRKKVTDVAVDLLGMPPDEVVIAPPGTVLKTSSGKIRRAASRELYEQKRIGRTGKAVWMQIAGIILSGFMPQVRKMVQRIKDYLYAAYCWSMYGLLSPPVWLLAVLLPRQEWRWWMTRSAARLLALLTGTRLTVQGLEHIPAGRPVIIAANHMSYLDSYVLQGILPMRCSFIAKAELAQNPLIRLPLTRLGAVLVERFDKKQALTDAGKIAGLAAGGRSLIFFPEGTFQRMPGLLPFRMGAFLTSAQSGVPVVPVTIRGTRSKLRSGSWFPRQGPVSVKVSKPVRPSGSDWQAALEIKDQVRSEILSHLGEPDLAAVHTSLSDLETALLQQQNPKAKTRDKMEVDS
ncbi:MAG: AMP-binding protein [Desulfobulbaceae bacterium]|nr:AMP-binding protein [Desulfobulbaceae bacterium]